MNLSFVVMKITKGSLQKEENYVATEKGGWGV